MACTFRTKIPTFLFIFLVSLLFSCDKDAELLSNHVLDDDQVAVLDDNFRVPAYRISILDVLSNDSYLSLDNTRIVDISAPANGRIRINEDNTITYVPKAVEVDETFFEEVVIKTPAKDEENIGDNSSQEADTAAVNAEDETSDTVADETASENDDNQESSSEEVTTQDPVAETETQEDVAASAPTGNTSTSENQETSPEAEADPIVVSVEEAPAEETPIENPETEETSTEETTSVEAESTDNTEQESEPEEAVSEEKPSEETDVENTANDGVETIESTPSQNEQTSVEDNPTEADEATAEVDQENSPSITEDTPADETTVDEHVSEETPVEEIQEDTFTYTTETEEEDGSVTTETATVTVEVESVTEAEVEVEPETGSSTETDYWRDAVIAGSRFLDEKYYDLDTGKIYSKEVNLQRGQVENYIEHENCPQRLKDKWDDRIEVSPSDVNGSQDGLQKIFDAHPRGTLFYLRAGTYQNQKNAVLKRNQDVVGASGALLDGSGIQGNSEDATRAIRSTEGGYIANLKVREYPTWSDPQNPRNPRGAALETIQNGAILNCEVHSHNKALSIVYGSKAMWNKFTAGRLGIYGYGSHDPNSPNRRGSVVKYNEWYNCNFNGYDGEHEAGGAKFVQVDGTLWSHNYIHDIPSGAGIWQDGDNRDSEVYNNVIIKTHRAIFSELSHTSNIHHNTVEYGTGFGAIYMSNAQGEKAHHNFIRWCRNGITIRDKERGTSRIYPGKAWRGINNEIYNNYIWQRPDPSTWTHGMLTLFDGHIDPNNTSNKWHDNHYYVDDNAEGSVLLSQEQPYAKVLMYCKTGAAADHKTISWDEWKKQSGDTNSTLEYERFF